MTFYQFLISNKGTYEMKPANAKIGVIFFGSFWTLYCATFVLVVFLEPPRAVDMIAPGVGLTALTYFFTKSFHELKTVEIDESGICLHPLGFKIDADNIENVQRERDVFQNDVIFVKTRAPAFLFLLGASSFGKKARIVLASKP